MPTVARPETKLNAQQQALLDEAIAAARRADAEEDAAWEAIRVARDAGVPDIMLCRRARRSRTTLNRKYGPRSD